MLFLSTGTRAEDSCQSSPRPVWRVEIDESSPLDCTGAVAVDSRHIYKTFCPHDNDRPAFGTDGVDWFGVSWSYVDTVGGQMVTPNSFVLGSPSEWREKLVFPDLDQMDFSVGAEEALSWLLEEPEDAADFFNAVADYKIALIDKLVKEWAPFDLLINSDDWGTQISTFMSPAVYKELIYPPMMRIARHVREPGLYWDCHSCGKTEALDPCIFLPDPGSVYHGHYGDL